MTGTKEAVAVVSPGQHMLATPGEWTNKEAQILANVISVGLTPDHMRAYAAICRHTGLDPFKRQIYAWIDKNKLTIHIAINGWRGMAAKSGAYNGQTAPEWCAEDGQWRDVWLSEKPPAAARVGVYRTGNPDPVYAVITWKEFKRDTPIWKEKPAHMLAIRAEYHALQKACPEIEEQVASVVRQFSATVEAAADEEMPQLPASDAKQLEQGEAVEDQAEQPALVSVE
jgi:hypothetical protein